MEIRKDQVALTTISRNVSPVAAEDGSCYDIQNLRPKDGAWRPILEKKVLHQYTIPANYSDVISVYGHDILPANEYVMYLRRTSGTYTVAHVLIQDGAAIVKKVLKDMVSGEEMWDLAWMDNIVVVTTEMEVTYHIYKSGEYLLNQPMSKIPDINIIGRQGELMTEDPGFTESHEQLSGAVTQYLQHKNVAEEKDYYAASTYLIAAYKMKDGTYIRMTNPVFIAVPAEYMYLVPNPASTNQMRVVSTGGKYKIMYYNFAKIKAVVALTQAIPQNTWDEVIDSVCVFATKQTDVFDTPAEIEKYNRAFVTYGERSFPPRNDMHKNFENGLFYKVGEIALKDMTGRKEVEISFKNIESKEVLPGDDQSYHELKGKKTFLYNGRLHLADISTSLYRGHRMFLSNMDAKYVEFIRPGADSYSVGTSSVNKYTIVCHIETSSGSSIVKRDISAPIQTAISTIAGASSVEHILSPVFTYPHPDAKLIEVYWGEGPHKRIIWRELKRHMFYSFSYFIQTGISGPYHNGVLTNATYNLLPDTTIPQPSQGLVDPNRLQVSKALNPMVYPPVYSYQIGEDDGNRIIDIAVQSAPVSEGQFGEFPVVIFGQKGITILNQGSGDVLYASMRWISGVIANKGVLGVDGGIIFTTKDGLYIIQGRQVRELSRSLISNEVYSVALDMQMYAPLPDDNDLLGVLQNVHFMWDPQHNEIVISNPTKSYHIRYSPERNSFYRASVGFHSSFLKNGTFYAVRALAPFNYIYDMASDRTTQTHVEIYFATNPITHKSLGFKKLYQSQLQCYIIIPGIIGRGMFRVYGTNYRSIPLQGTDDIKTEYDRIQEYISNLGDIPDAFTTDTGMYTTDEGVLRTDTVYIFAIDPGDSIRPVHDVNVVTGRAPQSVVYMVYQYSGLVHPNSAINSIITAVTDRMTRRMR
jgi:hypothetical protein